jgi:hypothetical protein
VARSSRAAIWDRLGALAPHHQIQLHPRSLFLSLSLSLPALPSFADTEPAHTARTSAPPRCCLSWTAVFFSSSLPPSLLLHLSAVYRRPCFGHLRSSGALVLGRRHHTRFASLPRCLAATALVRDSGRRAPRLQLKTASRSLDPELLRLVDPSARPRPRPRPSDPWPRHAPSSTPPHRLRLLHQQPPAARLPTLHSTRSDTAFISKNVSVVQQRWPHPARH